MTTVLVSARRNHKLFRETVVEALRWTYPSLILSGGALEAPAGPAELCIADAYAVKRRIGGDAVLLLRDAWDIPAGLCVQDRCIAVVDSGNDRLMRLVSGTGLPAITCGLSPRDTLTLSSIAEDSAVINLQRSVTCFGGAQVEPQEIPVQLTKSIGNFALMALACVCILRGDADRLPNINI